jgi:putative SOS response-associated peptidase YedK
MCGRFVAASPPDEIARYFSADVPEEVVEPSWNVAPTDDVLAVHADGAARRLEVFHWGLVPMWAKDPSIGSRMINARAESLAGKGAYQHAFRRRRCLVPADGFYEWKTVPGRKRKQPWFVHRADGEPMALAGLWERWRGADREDTDTLRSCTIITTTPNEVLAGLHDRMPVILPPSAWDDWLDPDNRDLDALGALLVPPPAELLELHPVSAAVGDVRTNVPELIEPVEPEGADAEVASAAPEGQRTLL